MSKEIITYMKIGKKIINGRKIVKVNDKYDVYTYTTCKKFDNWQILFQGYTYDFLKNYFMYGFKESLNQINNGIEETKNQFSESVYLYMKDFLDEELRWRKETFDLFVDEKCI